MFKNDNLSKDYIICKIIRLLTLFLRKRNIVNFDYICYDVHLLTLKCGFIEIVDDAETLFNLQNKYNTSILAYITNNNPTKTLQQLQSIFINSMAIYTVLSYLLGIGDRHLNNIMVHKTGILFHIDFGFILGKEPTFKSHGIRLTDDMLNTIGGVKSDNYLLFKNKCSEIFNFCRKYVGIVYLYLTLLIDETDVSHQDIIQEILRRFEPNEKYIDAEQHIKTIIDNSHDNVTKTALDKIQKFKFWLMQK